MADATTVVEGKIKFREGKKWKPRWCVLKKPSPVADQLQVVLYKDVCESLKNEAKPKSVFALDAFFGLDAGFNYDREPHVLAIICQKNVTLMAFELREHMIQFEIKIRQSLGEENQFPIKVVKAPSNSRLPKEQVNFMIHDLRFCLIAGSPPKILLSWNIEDLRRFGARDGKFCFEGGTRCGKGSGVFALQSEQAEDIADIVNLASTGKMSNCHRKFKNRSSQIDFSSHLIADMSSSPSSSSIHHPSHPNIAARAPAQGALPSTLNCCHDSQTGSAESEDWSWYKRHSVSVMDHRRIAALREKGFLENREQFVMGIYDVPPNHGRKLEDNINEVSEESNYARPRPYPEVAAAISSGTVSNFLAPITSIALSNNDIGHYKRIEPRDHKIDNDSTPQQRQASLKKRQSAGAEFFDNKVSSLEETIAGDDRSHVNEKNSHEESLQRLRKQESDLQREMVLLDEMLQDCEAKGQHGQSDASQLEVGDKAADISNAKSDSDSSAEKSFLSTLDHDFTIISGNIAPLKLGVIEFPQLVMPKKLDRTTVLRLNTSMPEGMPVSPLFHAKLNNIPPTSRLNAPLPYVNLSKYDDESNSHVHLPGSADCVPTIRGSHILALDNNLGTKGGLKGHSYSLSSLNTPVAASSLINISHTAHDLSPIRSPLFEPRSGGQVSHLTPVAMRDNGGDDTNDFSYQQEILVVKMDNHYGNIAQNAQLSSGSLVKNQGCSTSNASSDLITLLTSDAGRSFREEKRACKEGLYENLPLKRENTPPPALPPKGPALLKKLKAAASNNNKFQNLQNDFQSSRSVIPFSQETTWEKKSFGYDNQPRQVHLDKDQQKRNDTIEDNYLVMGSPKVRHKASPVFSSHKSNCVNPAVARGDYMDMGILGAEGVETSRDDEIYLDIDTSQTFYPRDLYISEADLKASSMSNINKIVGESTYMEMASVRKKSAMIQNLETLQTYVSKTPAGGKENIQSLRPTVSPTPHPPRPMSLKVRHNSDSGITIKSSCTDDAKNQTSPKPAKSPTKVYTKVKKSNQQQNQTPEPPMPFPNLIEFTKKMSESRSTYVNTFVDADKNLVPQETPPSSVSRDVPLPEPVKEGFLARFKRRSSKDKNACQIPEKNGTQKNRNSVLERSMSEHDSTKAAKEEKSSRLKLGRRRSSSFPNRLSYQESLDNLSVPMIKHTGSSSSSFSSSSSPSKPVLKHADQSESSSSIHDMSDDSDMSPLLKRSDKKMDPRTSTVLHVHRSDPMSVNPYMQPYKCLGKTSPLLTDSSKTDDEKLIEMIQKKGQSRKTVVYQRSSSLELRKQNQDPDQMFYFKLPHVPHRKERRFSIEKLMGCSSSSSGISCHQETYKSLDNTLYASSDHSINSSVSSYISLGTTDSVPPALPPKLRPFQGPLSPVIEMAPPIPSLNEPAPVSPQNEPVYVEIEEVLSMKYAERARQEKAQSALTLQPGEGEKDGNFQRPKPDVEMKAGRCYQPEEEENVSEQSYTTLTVPIDITNIEISELERGVGSFVGLSASPCCPSSTDIDSSSDCTSPAKTILRPRSGQEYVVIHRKCIATPTSSTSLPSSSHRVFSFDHQSSEPKCSHYQHLQSPVISCVSLSVDSHSPSPTAQRSPSISSAAEITHSFVSLHGDPCETDLHRLNHWREGKLHGKSVTATVSPTSSPQPVFSQQPMISISPLKESCQKSLNSNQTGDSIFFPRDMTYSSSPPSSPSHPSAQPSPHAIYVNQEFVDKHMSAASGSRTVSTSSSSHSSASPIRSGVQSLKSLIFRDFPAKRSTSCESHSHLHSHRKSWRTSGHSESDANRIEKHSLSLPASKTNQGLSLPVSVQRSHSDPKKYEKSSVKLAYAPESSSFHSKVHQKEFDKFANSSIISRRRLQCTKLCPAHTIDSAASGSRQNLMADGASKESGQLQVPGLKSSGYKNIDTLNAASASPRTISSGPDASHQGQTSQLENITESQNSSNDDSPPVDHSNVFLDIDLAKRNSAVSNQSGANYVTLSISLPHSMSPPPPLPRRRHLSSSPPSSPSLTPGLSPSDASDSPPSYFAPSPPSTPPPPMLPPRKPLILPPSPVAPSTPSEPDVTSDFSEEEQELNYIEIDLTRSSSATPCHQPVLHSHSSKRNRQRKNKDYAKLRYAVIDHRATKALKEARQEHEQGRDGSLRYGHGKDGNSGKSGVQLSRINSAPASSKRKPLSLIPRERKLSSGSVESC